MELNVMDEKSEVIEMTADIVSAYVGNNTIATSDLPALIQSVHRALSNITAGGDLKLDWYGEPGLGGNGRGCQVSEAWLIKEPTSARP